MSKMSSPRQAATPVTPATPVAPAAIPDAEFDAKLAELMRVAQELFRAAPDWVTFFREILGTEGAVRQLFVSPALLQRLEQTPEYEALQQMLAELRGKEPSPEFEPTKVITVRLPASLHDALRTEAHERRTSMNKLCISKLLQMVSSDLVPQDWATSDGRSGRARVAGTGRGAAKREQEAGGGRRRDE